MKSALEVEAERLDRFACAAIQGLSMRQPRMNPQDIALEAYRIALAAEHQRETVLLPKVELDEAATKLLEEVASRNQV